jgi:hypothetical protein
MSAHGTKRTLAFVVLKSAFDPKQTSMSQHQATPAQGRLAGKATDPVVNGGRRIFQLDRIAWDGPVYQPPRRLCTGIQGGVHMEAILPIIVQIVTGVLGGQAIGAVLQQVAMSQMTKIISGAVGGVAGGTLLSSLLGGAAGADPASAGALGGLLGDALGGAGGGAILTGIVGAVMKAMNK